MKSTETLIEELRAEIEALRARVVWLESAAGAHRIIPYSPPAQIGWPLQPPVTCVSVMIDDKSMMWNGGHATPILSASTSRVEMVDGGTV